jgi:hypothetical protein
MKRLGTLFYQTRIKYLIIGTAIYWLVLLLVASANAASPLRVNHNAVNNFDKIPLSFITTAH